MSYRRARAEARGSFPRAPLSSLYETIRIFKRIISLHRSRYFTRRYARITRLQRRQERQDTDERHRRGERVNRRRQFLLRLQRESSFAARRASLILRPRPFLSVVHVPASLAHPQLSVHQVRLPSRGFHELRRRRLLRRRCGESALRPCRRRRSFGFLLIEKRLRHRSSVRSARGLYSFETHGQCLRSRPMTSSRRIVRFSPKL